MSLLRSLPALLLFITFSSSPERGGFAATAKLPALEIAIPPKEELIGPDEWCSTSAQVTVIVKAANLPVTTLEQAAIGQAVKDWTLKRCPEALAIRFIARARYAGAMDGLIRKATDWELEQTWVETKKELIDPKAFEDLLKQPGLSNDAQQTRELRKVLERFEREMEDVKRGAGPQRPKHVGDLTFLTIGDCVGAWEGTQNAPSAGAVVGQRPCLTMPGQLAAAYGFSVSETENGTFLLRSSTWESLCLGRKPEGGNSLNYVDCADPAAAWNILRMPKVRWRLNLPGYMLRHVSTEQCLGGASLGGTSPRFERCLDLTSPNLARQQWLIARDGEPIPGLGTEMAVAAGSTLIAVEPLDALRKIRRAGGELLKASDRAGLRELMTKNATEIGTLAQRAEYGDTRSPDQVFEELGAIVELMRSAGMASEVVPLARTIVGFGATIGGASHADAMSLYASVMEDIGHYERSFYLRNRAREELVSKFSGGPLDDQFRFSVLRASGMRLAGLNDEAENELWQQLESYDVQSGRDPKATNSRLSLVLSGQAFPIEAPNAQIYARGFTELARIYAVRGWHEDAAFLFRAAIAIYDQPDELLGAPLLAARARLELAATLRRAGGLAAAAEVLEQADAQTRSLTTPDDIRRVRVLAEDTALAAVTGHGDRVLPQVDEASQRILVFLQVASSGRNPLPGEGRLALEAAIDVMLETLASLPPADPVAERALRLMQLRRLGTAATVGIRAAMRSALTGEAASIDRAFERSRDELADAEWAFVEDASRDRQKKDALLRRLDEARSEFIQRSAELSKVAPDVVQAGLGPMLSLADVRTRLGDGDGLMAFAFGEFGAVGMLLGKNRVKIARLALGSIELDRRVDELRAPLEAKLGSGQPEPPPFPLEKAHALYMELMAPLLDEPGEQPRHLLVVPTGALLRLPLGLLVVKPPKGASSGAAAYREAAWMMDTTAITVLPAVGLLRVKSESASGTLGLGVYLGVAVQQRTRAAMSPQGIDSLGAPTSNDPLSLDRGGGGISDLCALVPLNNAVQEVEEVSRIVGATSTVLFDERATERAVVDAMRANRYSFVHFAAHALLAGEWTRAMEPGIVLSGPCNPAVDAEDDYLSSSEVARLSMPGALIVLSACNSGGAADNSAGEGLSGLAAAFLKAGARELLVTHWNVADDAASTLMVYVVDVAARARVTLAEALRRSSSALRQADRFAHPRYWAVFAVIGDDR